MSSQWRLPGPLTATVQGTGTVGGVFDVDWMGLLTREVLRERSAELIAEACAWAVGISDQPHYLRVGGRIVATGTTVGERAAKELPLSDEEDGRLDLGDARPGSFQDALNAVGADGVLQAHRFDEERAAPLRARDLRARGRTGPEHTARRVGRARRRRGGGRSGPGRGRARRGLEAPLRIDAEHLVLAALGAVPLIEVEAEGLPLSLVRAAEAATRRAAEPVSPPPMDDDLAGSLFLAEAAVTATGAPKPVAPDAAEQLASSCWRTGWSRTRSSPSSRTCRCSRRPPPRSSRSSARRASADGPAGALSAG